MFNNHTMSLVTDVNMIGPVINNFDFVTVAAITTNIPRHPNFYNASILMPPTEALMEWADGNIEIYSDIYYKYLIYDELCDSFILSLIAALTKKNVILYIPEDEVSIYSNILLRVLYDKYGIVVSTPYNRFFFNIARLPYILCGFYNLGVMEGKDFIDAYPPEALPLPDHIIYKLAQDLKPFNRQAAYGEYVEYFTKLILSKNKSVEIPKIDDKKIMVKRVDKK